MIKKVLVILMLLSTTVLADLSEDAEKGLDMSNLGSKLAVCSAKAMLLAAVLRSEKEYSEGLIKMSLKWRVASIASFITDDKITQEDAKNAYEKVAGDTALSSGFKEARSDKPESIKLSEKIIYYIAGKCTPYDEYVESIIGE